MARHRLSIGIVVAALILLIVGAFLYARHNSRGNDVSEAVHDAPQRP
jgi:hypothetical protein